MLCLGQIIGMAILSHRKLEQNKEGGERFLENTIHSQSKYIAHLDPEGKKAPQSLKDHLVNVSRLAAEFAPTSELMEAARQCGLYHDVGKYSAEFQKYLLGQRHSRVDHSSAGAQLLAKNGNPTSIFEAFCIAGHHAGLPDFGASVDLAGESTLSARLKKTIPDYSAYHQELGKPEKKQAFESVARNFLINGQADSIGQSLWLRMLYSCLVDGDFLDTEAYMQGGAVKRGGFASLEQLHDRFFSGLEKKGFFSPQNELNRKRCEILRQCIQKGEKKENGLYTLTVPTGGGKTISAFAWALEKAKACGKSRIIYVIPYTSIIEQTADILRSYLGEENVIEHHSQVEYDDSDEQMDPRRLATENWDAPVIVTTNVQFFESLFANRSSRCRKLHNIANSILLFDEAQMFPINYMIPVLRSLEAMVYHFSCSVLLCSATQPRLDQFLQKKPQELMEDIPGLYRFFKRTCLVNDGLLSYDQVAGAMDQQPQSLCICLTKGEAREIYDRVQGKCFYLSTNLCPEHRQQVIRTIKEKLQKGESCRVVSTSIISVGVDIDFPMVYVEENGVDALIQGAGRCNREGKKKAADSLVHIFSTENSQKSRFLQQERQSTHLVEQRFPDLMSPEAIKDYFYWLYHSKNAILDKEKIIDLSDKGAYATIGRRFRLIDDHTKNVLIPWNGKAQTIAEQFRLGIRTRQLLRKAGQYMVSVWSQTNGQLGLYEQMLADGVTEAIDDQMAVLKDLSVYQEKTGLTYEQEEGRGLFA